MRAITMMQAQWKADEKEGESLHFELCKGGYFSDTEEYGLKVVGKTCQDGTPTPDSPIPIQCVKAGTKVKVYGKNLYDYTDIGRTLNGITFTPVRNGVIINGTATGQSYPTLVDVTKLLTVGRTYRMSKNNSNIVTIIQVRKCGTTSYPNSLYTVDGTEEYIKIYFYIAEGKSFDNFLAQIQFEEGSVITEFEPYVSGGEITLPCDLYEGDIFYPMSGKVVRTKGVKVFEDSLGWKVGGIASDGSDRFFYTEIDGAPDNSHTEIVCSHYPCIAIANNQTRQGCNITWGGLRIRWNSVGLSLGEWQDILDAFEPKMTVIYPFDTPITEQYDPQPVFAHQGTVNLLQEPTEQRATLKATMLVRR